MSLLSTVRLIARLNFLRREAYQRKKIPQFLIFKDLLGGILWDCKTDKLSHITPNFRTTYPSRTRETMFVGNFLYCFFPLIRGPGDDESNIPFSSSIDLECSPMSEGMTNHLPPTYGSIYCSLLVFFSPPHS